MFSHISNARCGAPANRKSFGFAPLGMTDQKQKERPRTWALFLFRWS
jgi:hypothetical protein